MQIENQRTQASLFAVLKFLNLSKKNRISFGSALNESETVKISRFVDAVRGKNHRYWFDCLFDRY